MKIHRCNGAAILCAALSAATAVNAQSPVDAGTLLRESQKPAELPPLPPRPQKAEAALADSGPKVIVQGFEVTGSTVYGPEVWAELLSGLAGRSLSFSELQAAADLVSQYYRRNGLHALSFLPEQDLAAGRVRIVVVEGRLGEVRVKQAAGAKVPGALLDRMIARGQTPGKIVDVDALERATLIANDIPGLKVTSVLAAGKRQGETDIESSVETQPVFSGNVALDNHEPSATGRQKTSGQLLLNNAFGFGEQAQLSLQASAGKRYGNLAFNLPLMPNGLRAGMNFSRLDYELQREFGRLGGEGQADTWGAFVGYPFIRSQQRNLSGVLSYSHSHQVNDATAGNLSDKRSQSLTFGLSGSDFGAGAAGDGVTIAGVSLVVGDVDLSGNAAELAQDAAGPRRNGRFAKTQFNLGRLQRLSANGALWLSVNGQLAFDNLDSGEEFSLGGPNGVRAFPALEAAGDQGFVMTAEYRYELSPAVRPKAFVDLGHIKTNRDNQFAGAPVRNAYRLSGAGIGLDLTPTPAATVRALLAWRLRNNPAAQANGKDSDGSRRVPQFWLQAALDF